MTVHTKSLARTTLNATETVKYTCPADTTTILKYVTINNASGASTTVILRMGQSGSPRTFMTKVLADQTSLELTTWLVLKPGDELRGSATNSPTVALTLSGAELIGVAP